MPTTDRGEASLLLLGGSAPPAGKPLSISPALALGFGAIDEMDGPWVGTWRPHRPRGPVLAQFTSPGPKYTVLGTTGHLAHNPTKTRAPAYSIPVAKLPPITSCSPGPRYFVPPEITRNGKYTSPSQHICGVPKIKTEITPGPSDYATEKANRQVFKRPPEQHMVFRHKQAQSQTPGPNAYTLPRLVGPNTAYTTASPCYSMVGKKKRGGFAEDLAKTPGPAAFPKVDVDVYKTKAPNYTMASKAGTGRDRTLKPGPADYHVGKVTLIKPEAPASTFGLRHSLYTMPLIVPP